MGESENETEKQDDEGGFQFPKSMPTIPKKVPKELQKMKPGTSSGIPEELEDAESE